LSIPLEWIAWWVLPRSHEQPGWWDATQSSEAGGRLHQVLSPDVGNPITRFEKLLLWNVDPQSSQPLPHAVWHVPMKVAGRRLIAAYFGCLDQ
jgi:hypothetical protein